MCGEGERGFFSTHRGRRNNEALAAAGAYSYDAYAGGALDVAESTMNLISRASAFSNQARQSILSLK